MMVSGISIFATMSQLCREYNAINLSQGCPDFDADPVLIDMAYHYMKAGCNQYTPMEGILPLREAISEKIESTYGQLYDPLTEITITCGATEAVFAAIKSLIKPGEEAIIFEPAFDSYVPTVKIAGGVPIPISLSYPHYKIDWNAVREKINGKTRLLIINSPHNPTGSILTRKDLEELEDIATSHHLTIISDEVYEHIVFDGNQHISLASSPKLKEKSLVIFSFGKTYHTTGWRLGYCLAGASLSFEFRKVHQFTTFSAATPLQYAIADYMKDKQRYLNLPLFFEKKRDLFLDLMKKSRFSFIPSQGTYFQLMSYSSISKEDDISFTHHLVKDLKVATIPLSPFYSGNYNDTIVRFCFAKKEETLIKAAEVLCKI